MGNVETWGCRGQGHRRRRRKGFQNPELGGGQAHLSEEEEPGREPGECNRETLFKGNRYKMEITKLTLLPPCKGDTPKLEPKANPAQAGKCLPEASEKSQREEAGTHDVGGGGPSRCLASVFS